MLIFLSKKNFFKLILVCFTLIYPLIVFIGVGQLPIWTFLLILLMPIMLRASAGKLQLHDPFLLPVLLSIIIVGLLGFLDSQIAVKIYPILINVSLAAIFGFSLFQTSTVIERLARLKEPNLSAHGIIYTRRVTILWLCFFLFNAIVSAWVTFYGSLAAWTIYNGLISYFLVGLLFTGEYIVRRRVRRTNP